LFQQGFGVDGFFSNIHVKQDIVHSPEISRTEKAKLSENMTDTVSETPSGPDAFMNAGFF